MILSRTDEAALLLAVATVRAESLPRRRQVDEFLATGDWLTTAKFCASCAQSRSLCLLPYEISPCDLPQAYQRGTESDSRSGGDAALALLQRMARNGISKWHPNPLEAIARAEQRAAT